jgi:hypothetical protein
MSQVEHKSMGLSIRGLAHFSRGKSCSREVFPRTTKRHAIDLELGYEDGTSGQPGFPSAASISVFRFYTVTFFSKNGRPVRRIL